MDMITAKEARKLSTNVDPRELAEAELKKIDTLIRERAKERLRNAAYAVLHISDREAYNMITDKLVESGYIVVAATKNGVPTNLVISW